MKIINIMILFLISFCVNAQTNQLFDTTTVNNQQASHEISLDEQSECIIRLHNSSHSDKKIAAILTYADAAGELQINEHNQKIHPGHSKNYQIGDGSYCPTKIMLVITTSHCSHVSPDRVIVSTPGTVINITSKKCDAFF